jgi:hypothetical protein
MDQQMMTDTVHNDLRAAESTLYLFSEHAAYESIRNSHIDRSVRG